MPPACCAPRISIYDVSVVLSAQLIMDHFGNAGLCLRSVADITHRTYIEQGMNSVEAKQKAELSSRC